MQFFTAYFLLYIQMCWNENISLNTFIFTTAALFFIYYNNTYTQYKIKEFNNNYMYLFVFIFTSMQLIEYFLWKSINTKNKSMNYIVSVIGWALVRIIQPIALLLLFPLKYAFYKKISFGIYFGALLLYVIYKFCYNPIKFVTTVGKNGHLDWQWLNNTDKVDLLPSALYVVCLFTLFFKFPIIATAIISMFVYSYLIFNTERGTMWCFISNSILLYVVFKILFILPFKEHSKIC